MVLSFFSALYICLKSPCNILGKSHLNLIIFWAKVTPSLGSQTPRIFKFQYFSWFRTFKFPEISLHCLKVQNNYVKMSSAFLALYQCLKSFFKVTEVVTYILRKKSPQGGVTLAQP